MRELTEFSTNNGAADPIAAFKYSFDSQGDAYANFAQGMGTIVRTHVLNARHAAGRNLERNRDGSGKLSSALISPALYPQWLEYLMDAGQRTVLFTDAMRQCGNYFVEHEDNANKTVLSWEHEVVVDGSKLDRPVNYSLVRIIASELGRFVTGQESSPGSLALLCPVVAFSVMAHFLINKGLVATGLIAKFGIAYWSVTAIPLAFQILAIWLFFKLLAKLMRQAPVAPLGTAATA
jgi:hypothetical protein